MPTVTTTVYIDAGTTSAGDLSEDTALLEPGDPALPVERPAVRQPAVKPVAVSKSRWRNAEYSWYGAPFYGSGTACGQTYSKSILGVAHLSLPCGTRVTLRNPANGGRSRWVIDAARMSTAGSSTCHARPVPICATATRGRSPGACPEA